MSGDVLRLDCDNLVIGSGLAGLVSALRLKGETIVASAGLGATAVSSGVLTWEQRDEEAERWFLDLMRSSGCPYRPGRCLTDMLVPSHGLVQEIMDYPGAPAIVSLDGREDGGSIAVDVELFSGRSTQEIARLVETDDAALDALGYALAAIGADSYLLPPVLGVSRAQQARARLQKMLNATVYEHVTAPSVHGLRLLFALRAIVDRRRNITVLESTRIECIDGGACGHMGTKAKREVAIHATNLVLATGGPLTGLSISGDRVYEPLTGRTVGDVGRDMDRSFFADHPLMFKGIGSRLPATGGFKEVRAAGAVAHGYGLYEALKAGYHAGDGL